jgi:hypothetical protein
MRRGVRHGKGGTFIVRRFAEAAVGRKLNDQDAYMTAQA